LAAFFCFFVLRVENFFFLFCFAGRAPSVFFFETTTEYGKRKKNTGLGHTSESKENKQNKPTKQNKTSKKKKTNRQKEKNKKEAQYKKRKEKKRKRKKSKKRKNKKRNGV
jgi:hypothetical protein